MTDDSNTWDAGAPGWTFDDEVAERLRATAALHPSSRRSLTREQFAAALCVAAGAGHVRFFAPGD